MYELIELLKNYGYYFSYDYESDSVTICSDEDTQFSVSVIEYIKDNTYRIYSEIRDTNGETITLEEIEYIVQNNYELV